MLETDENGDGVFEVLIIFSSKQSVMEVFTRKQDGSLVPVDGQILIAYKKQNAAIADIWDKAFDKGVDAEKFVGQVREMQKKVQDAKKELGK